MGDDYSIEQRYKLAILLRSLKKDISDVIDGLITNNVSDHEIMLLCERLIEFPELTYGIRKLTLEGVTLDNNPIQLSHGDN
jgi:hypothetical protein